MSDIHRCLKIDVQRFDAPFLTPFCAVDVDFSGFSMTK